MMPKPSLPDPAVQSFTSGIHVADPERIKKALSLGVDPNTIVFSQLHNQDIPAILAICHKRPDEHPHANDSLKILLDHGVNPNFTFQFYKNKHLSWAKVTPLTTVIGVSKNLEMAKTLLDAGAELLATKSDNEASDEVSALLYASQGESSSNAIHDMLDMLMMYGLNLSREPVQNKNHTPWLCEAVIRSDLSVVKKMVVHGANLNLKNNGIGCVGLAAMIKKPDIFNYLMDIGAPYDYLCTQVENFNSFLAAWTNSQTSLKAAQAMREELHDGVGQKAKERKL